MINWAAYIEEVMETYVLGQVNFGRSLGLTQQAISNWKTGARRPNKYRQTLMREQFPDVDPDDFTLPLDELQSVKTARNFRALRHDVRAFCERMSEVNKRKRVRIFRELGPLVDKAEEQRQASIALRQRIHEKRAAKMN
jgi:hypothetical protein